jgi:4-hydroxy-3-methylbut-2-enyl diphosphate reductase
MITGTESVVGVTAGASAPEDIVQGVIAELRRRGAKEVEEFVLLEEDVEFKLPPGLIELYRGRVK